MFDFFLPVHRRAAASVFGQLLLGSSTAPSTAAEPRPRRHLRHCSTSSISARAQYMMGRVRRVADAALWSGIPFGWALILVPIVIGATASSGTAVSLPPLSSTISTGLLLTFGLALIIEASFASAMDRPASLQPTPSGRDQPRVHVPAVVPRLGRRDFPVVCLAKWLTSRRQNLEAIFAHATENPTLVRAFRINRQADDDATYVSASVLPRSLASSRRRLFGQTRSWDEADHRVFASCDRRHGLDHGLDRHRLRPGIIEGMTKVFYPEGASTVIFVIMAIVLMLRPAGLFGTPR